MIRALLTLVLLAALPAAAEEKRVIASLSQNAVSITTDFSGSEIFVYGAIEHGRFPDRNDSDLSIIIAVSGPLKPVTVRKKARVFGIWANAESAMIDLAPSFYALVTTGPIEAMLTPAENARAKITVDHSIQIDPTGQGIDDPQAYRDALIRLNRARGAYFDDIGAVNIIEKTLFETTIRLPANLIEGNYEAKVFLIRGGLVVDDFSTEIRVRKVGLERWIYNLAHEQSLLYGILSILVALLAGWGASEAFRLMRR